MPYGDLLEKAEFMQRLADARIKNITKPAEEPKTEEPAAKVRLDLDEAMRQTADGGFIQATLKCNG